MASPYWPAFASEWVRICYELFLWFFSERRPPCHFAGMPSVDPLTSVDSLLEDMGFQVPKGSDRLNIATRVSAGVQPTGRSLPQLLPDGLGPNDHLKVARPSTHPMSRPPSLPKWIVNSLEFQDMDSALLVALRKQILLLLSSLAEALKADNLRIVGAVHPYLREVVAKRNVAFMREVTFIAAGLDPNLMIDYVFGLPMLGWARHSPVMVQRQSDPPRSERPSPEEIVEENKIALERAKPSRSEKLDELAWAKTEK